jgi:NACalpha-BTF3-like transcription factor
MSVNVFWSYANADFIARVPSAPARSTNPILRHHSSLLRKNHVTDDMSPFCAVFSNSPSDDICGQLKNLVSAIQMRSPPAQRFPFHDAAGLGFARPFSCAARVAAKRAIKKGAPRGRLGFDAPKLIFERRETPVSRDDAPISRTARDIIETKNKIKPNRPMGKGTRRPRLRKNAPGHLAIENDAMQIPPSTDKKRKRSDRAILLSCAVRPTCGATVVSTRGDRLLGDGAADPSLVTWVQRTRGAALPPWAAGIEAVDLALGQQSHGSDVLLEPPRTHDDSADKLYASARLKLLRAQWGDGEAARRLCDMAEQMCSTDARGWRHVPHALLKAVALWHPVVARAHGMQVRSYVPVLAEMAAADDESGDPGPIALPTCVVCMCDPPAMVTEPCGHLCLCADDWRQVAKTGGPVRCPLCRADVEAAWHVRSPCARCDGTASCGADADGDDSPNESAVAMQSRQATNAFTPSEAGVLFQVIDMLIQARLARVERILGGDGNGNANVGSDSDEEEERIWGDGYSYRMGGDRSTRLQGSDRGGNSSNRVAGDDDDDIDDDESSSDSDDDDVPLLREEGESSVGAERHAIGDLGSTGLPFDNDDVLLVAEQARVPRDVAFDALLATEGDIIAAIGALS